MPVAWVRSSCLALWLCLAPGAATALDVACVNRADSLEEELDLEFSDPDDPGLFERKQRIRALFEGASPGCARDLLATLGEERTGQPLSEKFHGKLHRATRRSLLQVLEARKEEEAATPAPTPKPAPKPAPLPSDRKPLASSQRDRLARALDALDPEVAGNPASGFQAKREACWLEKLRRPDVDDRVIQWETICPRTSMASAPFVTSCNIQFRNVSEKDLFEHIKETEDVEPANRILSFVTHAAPSVVVNHEITDFALENFRQLATQSAKTVNTLNKMANKMGLGGASAMPHYYRAIAGWIGERQKDEASLLSCM